MNERRCWAVGLLGLLLLAGGAASAEPAADALKKGTDCLGEGDTDSAISAYTEAIRLDPKLAKAYWGRGVAYGMKGDCDKAIADFTEAIRINPKYAEAYHGRGTAHEKKGEKAKAEEDFAQAKKLGYTRK